MKLRDAILSLDWFSNELCIVAKQPWTTESESKLIMLTEDGRVPADEVSDGYEYFLEVAIIKDELLDHMKDFLTPSQRIELVIHYAENDATPEWFNELCSSKRV
jgi:hypothetical protein